MVQSGKKKSENCPNSFKMDQNVSICFKTVQNGPTLSKMVQNLSKIVQIVYTSLIWYIMF